MSSLEAKIVVVGSQGVGKTSLVTRFCKGSFDPSQITSTVGASFLTKRVVDSDSDTVVRLQIWDTAGQERFRSISRLYYRGANACILCYSITDAHSFAEMGSWLTELRRNLPPGIVLHVVGTKADIVARDPAKREVPFERCIAYVAENLAPGLSSTPPPTAGGLVGSMMAGNASGAGVGGSGSGGLSGMSGLPPPGLSSSVPGLLSSAIAGAAAAGAATGGGHLPAAAAGGEPRSPSSKRSSGFWGQEAGWDACHEISAESGEGVEEVFRVVTRKLVEQNRKMQQALLAAASTPGGPPSMAGDSGYGGYGGGGGGGYGGGGGGGSAYGGGGGGGGSSSGGGDGGYGYGGGYHDGSNNRGSFRVGRDRRSWLFAPGFAPDISVDPNAPSGSGEPSQADGVNRKGCC